MICHCTSLSFFAEGAPYDLLDLVKGSKVCPRRCLFQTLVAHVVLVDGQYPMANRWEDRFLLGTAGQEVGRWPSFCRHVEDLYASSKLRGDDSRDKCYEMFWPLSCGNPKERLHLNHCYQLKLRRAPGSVDVGRPGSSRYPRSET